MKKLFVLLTAMLVVSSIATVVVATSNGPTEIKYSPKMGEVTFDHLTHQGRADCATCHHTGDYNQCKSCHGSDNKAPKSKDAYHKLCVNCHKELQKGPSKCKECHIK